MEDRHEKELAAIKKSMIYELRLFFDAKEQTAYTKEEILEILDEKALELQ